MFKQKLSATNLNQFGLFILNILFMLYPFFSLPIRRRLVIIRVSYFNALSEQGEAENMKILAQALTVYQGHAWGDHGFKTYIYEWFHIELLIQIVKFVWIHYRIYSRVYVRSPVNEIIKFYFFLFYHVLATR